MSATHCNLCCSSAAFLSLRSTPPLIETVVDNPEPWKSEFSLIVHKGGITTHFQIGVGDVYFLICFKSHISYE